MSSSTASTSRTCPACGARNSGISLFCAECGSSLNSDTDRNGDTAANPTRSSPSQHTEPFSPALGDPSDNERWRKRPGQHQDETAPFEMAPSTPRSSTSANEPWRSAAIGTSSDTFAADPLNHRQQPATVTMVENQHRGARGFFLGLLAFILIAIVVGLYGWTAWLSADLRDTISSWFGFIS